MDEVSIEIVKELFGSGELKSILIQIFIIFSIAIFLDYLQRRTIKKISEKNGNKGLWINLFKSCF